MWLRTATSTFSQSVSKVSNHFRPFSRVSRNGLDDFTLYVSVGCTALRLILRNFSPVIKSNVQAPLHTIGVDVSREERYHKCVSCYEKLMSVRSCLMKKQNMPGKMGSTFRELGALMQALE